MIHVHVFADSLYIFSTIRMIMQQILKLHDDIFMLLVLQHDELLLHV